MFQPETEDMLPRMAPKPSAAVPMGSTEPMVRPQVPEVSILFGAAQQGANLQMQQQNIQQTTSYAAWKKQILPKVTFPPGLVAQEQMMGHEEVIGSTNNNAGQDYNVPRSNLYPLRAASIPAVSMGLAANVNSNVYMAASNNNLVGGYNSCNGNVMTNPSCYRRSLDSCNNNNNINYQPQQTYGKPQETKPPSMNSANGSRDILTICAGTQTEALGSPLQNSQLPSAVASKQDIDEIRQKVQEIRNDQLRLMQILETFIFSQHTTSGRTAGKDAAVQVDCDKTCNGNAASPPFMNGCCPDLAHTPVTTPTNKFIEHLKPATNILQTPKSKPMAQSTTYRPNTPQTNRLLERQQTASPPPSAPANYQQREVVLPKSATDQSLVMNELALKYLPNEKLAELLKELNITSPLAATAAQKQIDVLSNPPSTPLRNVENFERNATDISNASYKYLKKYRLLPEDYDEGDENDNPAVYNAAAPPAQQYDALRNSPVQHRQQPNIYPQTANSPYQQQLAGRLPPSPLVRSSPPPQYRDNMLNLENIKQQPKFL